MSGALKLFAGRFTIQLRDSIAGDGHLALEITKAGAEGGGKLTALVEPDELRDLGVALVNLSGTARTELARRKGAQQARLFTEAVRRMQDRPPPLRDVARGLDP